MKRIPGLHLSTKIVEIDMLEAVLYCRLNEIFCWFELVVNVSSTIDLHEVWESLGL